jgi:hypothetical protein
MPAPPVSSLFEVLLQPAAMKKVVVRPAQGRDESRRGWLTGVLQAFIADGIRSLVGLETSQVIATDF